MMITVPLFFDRMQNVEATCQKFQKYYQTGGKPHIFKMPCVSNGLTDEQIHSLIHDV